MPEVDNYYGSNKFNNEYTYSGPAYNIVPDDNRPSDLIEYQGPLRDWTYDAPSPDQVEYLRPEIEGNPLLTTYGREIVYSTYAGTDIVAQFVMPNENITIGELQTISYSTHRENVPVRILGHVAPISFVRGPRTIAGSLIFTVFNHYAFYKLKSSQEALNCAGIYLLADMLPPFDIVLTFSNESGALSKMRILGVQIIDEGGTMSVDDLVTEQTYSFMARAIQPMTSYSVREFNEEG